MVTSFITFFMIGVTLSIHPASIMVGTNTYIESQSKWTRWNGYIIFVLLLFVMDLFLTNAVYLAFYDIYGNLKNIGHLDVLRIHQLHKVFHNDVDAVLVKVPVITKTK